MQVCVCLCAKYLVGMHLWMCAHEVRAPKANIQPRWVYIVHLYRHIYVAIVISRSCSRRLDVGRGCTG